jgi:hypothetical protein
MACSLADLLLGVVSAAAVQVVVDLEDDLLTAASPHVDRQFMINLGRWLERMQRGSVQVASAS